MRDLVTGYAVTPRGILFTVRDRYFMDPGAELNFRVSTQRWCVGYDEPGGDVGSCPDDAPAKRAERCEACAARTAREICQACTGATCGNPQRRTACVFADHFVYLALYDAENIKVGTTKVDRLEMRLREQGAVAGIAIANAGGQIARQIEKSVADAGWRDRYQLLPLLCHETIERDRAEPLLRAEMEKVTSRLGAEIRFMNDGPFIWCGDALPAPLKFPPRQLQLGRDNLAGTVVGVRGNYLLIEAEGEVFACSLRQMVGRELTRSEGPVHGPAQAALVF